jgi:hypothetical protein
MEMESTVYCKGTVGILTVPMRGVTSTVEIPTVPLHRFHPPLSSLPEMALATLVAFSGPKKVLIFSVPPPPKMALVMGSPSSKPLRTAEYKQRVH